MYARYIVLTLGTANRPLAEKICDEAAEKYAQQRGFKSVTFLFDDALGEYASLSLWDSRDDAEAGADALRPWLLEVTAGQLLAPPEARFFEGYEPKG